MGAKVGVPDKIVWGIDGDVAQMTNQELAPAHQDSDQDRGDQQSSLGMVRQWQTLPTAATQHRPETNRIPDFREACRAMGCVGLRAEEPADVDSVIEKAN
jgi:acetolactate synthase-1/2/3 large subunit